MSQNRPPPPFKNRWLISGTLKTKSPLHIGDGFSAELHTRSQQADKTKDDPEHDVQTVCVDCCKKPYIPGSSLRGVLRSVVNMEDPASLEVFGSPDPEAKEAKGGKLIVYDAFIHGESLSVANDPLHLPFWSKDRRTCVAAHVSIDRQTRTAADKLLFHTEYVPAGTEFLVELGGDGLESEEVTLLLGALDQFNQGLRLGADIASGWGQVEWTLGKVRKLDDIKKWTGNRFLPELSPDQVLALFPSTIATKKDLLLFDLVLHFSGPLLVRDPKQSIRSDEAKSNAKKHRRQAEKQPNATPLLAEDKRPFIPGQAVRGVLRSRLECIMRTLGHSIPSPDKQPVVTDYARVQQLDMAAIIFGAPGWKAPLECARFTLKEDCKPLELSQEFVAIDRFTGSVAGRKKFDAKAIVGASLSGRLILDLERIPAALRLEAKQRLALLFRDLMDGDLHFGSGASKGYGHCVKASGKVSDQKDSDLCSWITTQLRPTPA
jgi:CRISPR/Cas system CSM-associated protein Csm3 (group 7 of RAMP superfamily)